MRHYTFVNEELLNEYLEQLPKKYFPKEYRRKKLISFGITGVRTDISEEDFKLEMNKTQKIDLLLKYLRENEQLDLSRPKDMHDGFNPNRKAFVLETTKATQIFFPKESLIDTPYLDGFALWISDPNTDDIQQGNLIYNYTGTFLYITQMWLDNGKYSHMYSGCSALQSIVNFLEGRPILNTILHAGEEKFGRSDKRHPIDKLVGLGAKRGATKKITCLYRKRYITNEQCFIFNNKEARVNDLLAYPIFITEEV
ncbi:hypothetical protein [Saccharibacillus kuerlensis]|uniref:Uncharacterized protein n=1 Tax=Saccharibacillus kuerlensis TaxID=459527 RepID=A0ABQ2L9L5_9BACL|nr:hypothetical protein [Saccharibacillus kuerlensis]GGO05898.1 hypothetical protein GCM10010969_32700 [Saccharibacillus kuerlensis]